MDTGLFDHPVTNTYTESLNNLIRMMNRLGRSYSFEALRAKILFAEGAHKHKNSRPKFERKEKERIERMPDEFALFSAGVPFETEPKQAPSIKSYKPKKNYGVDISTLAALIESGEL